MKIFSKLSAAFCAGGILLLLSGCGTTTMYKARLEAQEKRDANATAIEQTRNNAAAACYSSLGALGSAAINGTGEALVLGQVVQRMAAMMHLKDCDPQKSAQQVAAQPQAPLPDVPDGGVLSTVKTVVSVVGAIHPLVRDYYTFATSRESVRSNERISLGEQAARLGMFNGQAAALSGVGIAGFGALKDTATSGFGAMRDLAVNTKPTITNVLSGVGALNTGDGTATANTRQNSNDTRTENNCPANGGTSGQTSASSGSASTQSSAPATANGAPPATVNADCKG